jgi:hypothetical protein
MMAHRMSTYRCTENEEFMNPTNNASILTGHARVYNKFAKCWLNVTSSKISTVSIELNAREEIKTSADMDLSIILVDDPACAASA